MKLKTFIMLPLVIGVVGYVGIKGYLYFKVKGNLDDMSRMAAPFASITYGGISTDLTGKLGISDVKVTPIGTSLLFRMDEIEIEGPDVEFLLALSNGFRNEQTPPRYGFLRVRRAEIPSGDEVLSQFTRLSMLNPGQVQQQMPETCSLAGIFSRVGMEEIGYDKMIADFSIGYQFSQGEMEVSMDYDIRDLEAMDMEIVMNEIPRMGSMMMGQVPSIRKIEASYRLTPEYIKRMLNYCAEAAESTPELFIDSLFNKPDSYYARNLGIIPGQGIKSAMRSLLDAPGEVIFSAYPTTEINTQMMSVYSPQDILSLMGAQLSVNGQVISDMSFSVVEPEDLYADDSVAPGPGLSPDEPVRRLKPKRYIDTELSELQRYVGRQIRITDAEDGRVTEGVLDSLENNIASIEQYVYGGKFTSHVPLKDIRRAEVMRRE